MARGGVNLKNVGIVLVDPIYAGNLGACAGASGDGDFPIGESLPEALD